MILDLRPRAGLFSIASAAVALAIWAPAGSGSDAALGCASFASQADAQARFTTLGGSPRHAVGVLDGDRDGIACEGLPAPYAAYAALGYNRKGGFLYGVASMPPTAGGKERFPCLHGNRKGPLGPRRLRVYRVRPGGDKRILGAVASEAKPGGRLLWKAQRATLLPGLYYVAFEESIRLTPYGRNKCPGFRSREVQLPPPRQAATS